jgi:hypothetical protein
MLTQKQKTIIWAFISLLLQLIVCLMLLLALRPSNRYGYYIALRWVCCLTFGFLAIRAFLQKKESWGCVLAIIAAIYNPIIRVHLTRDIWSVINVITIGIAVASIFGLRMKDKKTERDRENDGA